MTNPSAQLAAFAAGLRFEAIPETVVRKAEDLLQILERFAGQLMPNRRMKEPERVLSQGDTVVRVAGWGGTAAADVPGFGKAGEAIEIIICSVMRFDDAGLLVEWKDYG